MRFVDDATGCLPVIAAEGLSVIIFCDTTLVVWGAGNNPATFEVACCAGNNPGVVGGAGGNNPTWKGAGTGIGAVAVAVAVAREGCGVDFTGIKFSVGL